MQQCFDSSLCEILSHQLLLEKTVSKTPRGKEAADRHEGKTCRGTREGWSWSHVAALRKKEMRLGAQTRGDGGTQIKRTSGDRGERPNGQDGQNEHTHTA